MRGDEARWPDLFWQTSERWTTRRVVSALLTAANDSHHAATCGSSTEKASDVAVMSSKDDRSWAAPEGMIEVGFRRGGMRIEKGR